MARHTITHRKALQYAKALAAHERASLKNPRESLRVEVWEERDRLHIALYRGDTLLAEWWDDDARQMFEDGFFVRGPGMEQSVIDFARDMGFTQRTATARRRAAGGGKNPPTRKARAFIGRKIRRLAHEGMQAPRRIAAAYSLARRAGFKVPKRARKNPRQYSERDAWSVVENAALRILEQKASARVHREAEIVRLTAVEMKAQLSEGVHTNPTLAVLGNPPAQVVGTLSHRLYELRYKHAADGKDYRHPFGPGATISLLRDGSVWIHAKHRLWEDV